MLSNTVDFNNFQHDEAQVQIEMFKAGDNVRTFKSAIIEGNGVIVGVANDEVDNLDDCYVVDFGEEGTCTVHKDDMEHIT